MASYHPSVNLFLVLIYATSTAYTATVFGRSDGSVRNGPGNGSPFKLYKRSVPEETPPTAQKGNIVKISWKSDSLVQYDNSTVNSQGENSMQGAAAAGSKTGISGGDNKDGTLLSNAQGSVMACYGRTMYHRKGPLNEQALNVQVGELADEIIKYYTQREFHIGLRAPDVFDISVRGYGLLKSALDTWDSNRPSVRFFLRRIYGVLDSLRFITPDISTIFNQIHLLDNETNLNESALNPKPTRSSGRGVGRTVVSTTEKILQVTTAVNGHHHHHHNHHNSNRHKNEALPPSSLKNAEPIENDEILTTAPPQDYTFFARPPNHHAILSRKKRSTPCTSLATYSTRQSIQWWSPLKKTLNFLDFAKAWYEFLEEFHRKIETLQVQKNVLRNVTGAFTSWDGSDSSLTLTNLVTALEKINDEFKLDTIKDQGLRTKVFGAANATTFRLDYLSQMVKSGLKTRAVCARNNTNRTMTMSGPYVFISEAKKCIVTITSHVSLLASHKIFIDDSWDLGGRNATTDLTIIAPTWHVLAGNFMLNVSGGAHTNKSALIPDGRPGDPGPSGGHFIGMVHSVETEGSGSTVKIASNGSMGETGEYGYYKTVNLTCDNPQETPMYWCCSRDAPAFHYKGKHGGKAGLGGHPGLVDIIVTGPNKSAICEIIQTERAHGPAGFVGKGGKHKIETTVPPAEELQKAMIIKTGDYYCTKQKPDKKPSAGSTEFDGEDGKDEREPKAPEPFQTNINRAACKPIISFKQLIRSDSTLHIFSTHRAINHTEIFDLNETIVGGYTPLDFINELSGLEESVIQLQTATRAAELYFHYTSLLVRSQRARNMTNNTEHALVLEFLTSTVRSRKLHLTNPWEPFLVVDMELFFKLEQENVKKLKEAVKEEEQYQHIQAITDDYLKRINSHFAEGIDYVENLIIPEIQDTEKKMFEITDFLVMTLKDLLADEMSNAQALAEHRKAMQKHAIINGVLGGLKIAAAIVSFWFPIGGAVAAGIDLLNSIFNPKPVLPPQKPIIIPPAVKYGAQNSALRFRNYTGTQLDVFKTQIDEAEKLMKEEAQTFKQPLEALAEYRVNVSMLRNVSMHINETVEPQHCFDQFLLLLLTRSYKKDVIRNLTRDVKEAAGISGRAEGGVKAMEIAGNVQALFMAGTDYMNQLRNDALAIKETTYQISVTGTQIALTESAINRVEHDMAAEITGAFFELSELTADLNGKSVITLDIVRWRIQSILRDVKTDLYKEHTEGTQVDAYISRALEKIEDALTTMVLIFQRIQQYREHAELVNFTSAVNQDASHYFAKLSDPELDSAFTKLRFLLQGGVITKRFTLVAASYRMWSFPVVNPALCDLNEFSTPGLNLTDRNGILKTLGNVEHRLEVLKKVITDCKVTTCPGDEYRINVQFDHTANRVPLFTWHNASSYLQINSLLEGRSVQFYANVLEGEGAAECDAVKFNRIFLHFQSSTNDTEHEEKFHKALDSFAVSMTHQGNNYYLFGNEVYTFVGTKLVLYFSFFLNSDGRPDQTNDAYEKLLKGDLTLSPYAPWDIKIEPLRQATYDDLKGFKNHFDMHLEGAGKCFRKSYAETTGYSHPECLDNYKDKKKSISFVAMTS